MIEKRTVLILGAGASIDYNYPSGPDLRDDILRKSFIPFSWQNGTVGIGKVDENAILNDDIKRIAFLHFNCGFAFEHIDQFCKDLSASPRNSIDAFLEDRSEYLQIGKMLIAMSIYGYERYVTKQFNPNSQQWYRYLFNMVAPSWEVFTKTQLSIVTYNYDRSFETYFIRFLMSTFGKNLHDCLTAFNQAISVIHVHGCIANSLPFDPQAKQYNGEIIGQYVRQGANQLKIIHEEVNYKAVHGVLQSAEQIFILGFGFHERNLDRLKLSDYSAPIYSTRTSITDLNVERFNELTNGCILFSPNKDSRIVDFFENDVSLYGKAGNHMPKRSVSSIGYVGR